MHATRTDVARLAGVSTATVSNVLNHSDKVKEATINRVMAAVRELDYRPDMIARSMTTKQTMQLGIVIQDLANPFYGELIREFESAASERGYFVSVCTGLNKLDDYFDNFIARRMDGVFVAAVPYNFQEEKVYDLVDKGIKVVTSGNVLANFRKVSSIESDYLRAMTDAMTHLTDLGHSRIAYLSGLGRELTYDLRLPSYLQLAATKGYGDELLIDGSYPYETNFSTGYDSAMRLLKTGKEFTAVICGNDLMAIGAIKAFQEQGLRVPEDISVMGFDGIAMGSFWSPSLTTMSVDKTALGRKAFDLLYNNMHSETVGYYRSQLTLVKGQSTAARR